MPREAPFGRVENISGDIRCRRTRPHFGTPPFLVGYTAVCCFFIISGFVISHALRQKYAGHLARFYVNRILRLAPTYYIVFILFVAFNAFGWLAPRPGYNEPVAPYLIQHGTWSGLLWSWFVNLTLVGVPIATVMRGVVDIPLALAQMFTVDA